MLTNTTIENLEGWLKSSGAGEVSFKALEEFKTIGFPTNKLEEWKYASLKSLNAIDWQIEDSKANPIHFFKEWNASFRLAFTNGNFSVLGELPKGVNLISLPELLSSDADFAKQYAERRPISDQNILYKLGSDIQSTQVLVVEKNTQIEEAGIISIANELSINNAFVPVNIIIYVKEGAEISLIEKISNQSNYGSFINLIQEVFVEKEANFELYKIQDSTNEDHLVDHCFVYQGEKSTTTTHTFTLNGGFTRNNAHFYIQGEYATANLNGLYIPSEKQLIDHHTVVDHLVPNSESNELYKGVLSGQSTGVFNGKIFVRKDAQKTNAFQNCRNILASDNATMNTKPQLEIWADDVKCSHGTTTGQLSETALFYLRSRGISENSAKALLMLAFGQEVIDQVGNQDLKEYLTQEVENKLKTSLNF